jgi:hypothetical protein
LFKITQQKRQSYPHQREGRPSLLITSSFNGSSELKVLRPGKVHENHQAIPS